MKLEVASRNSLAQKILSILRDSVKGSTAQLRGSLAEGTADPYSDIDILWEIPDNLFAHTIEYLPALLADIRPVESLRYAPEFQRSDRRRLVFIQFEDIPLFWRVELDIFAQSLQGNDSHDFGNREAFGDDWSLVHSALMNAVAAIKALLRNEEDQAKQLIARACQRVGLQSPRENTQDLILKLAHRAAAMDFNMVSLAERVITLHHQAFGSDS